MQNFGNNLVLLPNLYWIDDHIYNRIRKNKGDNAS